MNAFVLIDLLPSDFKFQIYDFIWEHAANHKNEMENLLSTWFNTLK